MVGLKADTVEEGVHSLAEAIRKMNKDINIPASFKEAGVDEKEFLDNVDQLADRAFEDQCTPANPRLPLVTEIKKILLDSYYGKQGNGDVPKIPILLKVTFKEYNKKAKTLAIRKLLGFFEKKLLDAI